MRLSTNPVDLPSPDPWWDLYVPAILSGGECAEYALDRLPDQATPAERGNWWAVAARGWAVMGRAGKLNAAAERAFALGGPEADALATFLRPSGQETALRRIQNATEPGEAADAACDLAALRLLDSDVPGAMEAVAMAFSACPEHAETGRWRRFFAECQDPARVAAKALTPGKAHKARGTVGQDALELLPTPRTGWVSDERYARQLNGSSRRGPVGSALWRLQQAGVMSMFFATEAEYARLHAASPLADLEVLADRVCRLVNEGRDARDVANEMWSATFDDALARRDAAEILCAQATQDRRLAPLALIGVESLLDMESRHPVLWLAYRAWLRHLAGAAGSVTDARLVLADPTVDGASWAMAIATLNASGKAPEARDHAKARLHDEALRPIARAFLKGKMADPRMAVSPRLHPRTVGDDLVPRDVVTSGFFDHGAEA